MKLTKSQLKQIIKEEIAMYYERDSEKDMMANMARADAAKQRAKNPMQRGADLHEILKDISDYMADKFINEPTAGIKAWLEDPLNRVEAANVDIQALYDMSDEIYDYM